MTHYDTTTVWRQACAAALAGLPDLGPERLAAALAESTPEEVWEQIADGVLLPGSLLRATEKDARLLIKRWQHVARKTNPLDVIEQYHAKGISIWTPSDDYPVTLLDDPARPAVLFWKGRPQALAHPSVAIIGTRRATHLGKAIAQQLATELTEAGVSVVSGLALGIDGAAHKGALAAHCGAEAIGVVGSGLDQVYPQRHRDLWEEVGERGLLISEAPLGAAPMPWRFPARNRIIAGLADVLVVVESAETGGSMLTVKEAMNRDVDVMAVPGSIRSSASKGTNLLLRDGALAVLETADVLMQLQARTGLLLTGGGEMVQQALPVDDQDVRVLEAIGWDPASTDEVLLRLDLPLGEVATALARLQQGGWIHNLDGWWRRC